MLTGNEALISRESGNNSAIANSDYLCRYYRTGFKQISVFASWININLWLPIEKITVILRIAVCFLNKNFYYVVTYSVDHRRLLNRRYYAHTLIITVLKAIKSNWLSKAPYIYLLSDLISIFNSIDMRRTNWHLIHMGTWKVRRAFNRNIFSPKNICLAFRPIPFIRKMTEAYSNLIGLRL